MRFISFLATVLFVGTAFTAPASAVPVLTDDGADLFTLPTGTGSAGSDVGPLTGGLEVNINPFLTLTEQARVTFTFLGEEAGFANKFFRVGGTDIFLVNQTGSNSTGDTFSAIFDAGILDIGYSTTGEGGGSVFNDGTTTGVNTGVSMAWLSLSPTSGILGFDDGGGPGASGQNNDYDDLVVAVGVSAVPLPASALLLLGGLGGLTVMRRRRKS